MDCRKNIGRSNKECNVQTTDLNSNKGRTEGRYLEVDESMSMHTFADINPILSISQKRDLNDESCNRGTKLYSPKISVSSPLKSDNSNTLFDGPNMPNSSYTALVNSALNTPPHNEESKSFIQQRVERLYGPGALAQGFFFKRTSFSHSSCSENIEKTIAVNDPSIYNANSEEFLKNLPVLRHLRPEFRAQLPIVSSRRVADDSQELMKPLQKLSIAPEKPDVKFPTSTLLSMNVNGCSTQGKQLELKTSVVSISDQQLAAPEVVLPVLQHVTSSSSVAESKDAIVEEKDGNYFTKLLKAEVDRLFTLAASAEAELLNVEELPDDAAGKLRSAAGKARLLATQKMQQFEGLCQKNINQLPGEAFPTTNEDLAGFWDMVMLQVVQVNDLFEHISKLRHSQWQEVVPEKKLTETQIGNNIKRRNVVSQKSKPAINEGVSRKIRVTREQARRQMLEERRKAMKFQNKFQQSIEIFAPKI